MSLEPRRFTFLELAERTPDLDPPARAAVFDALPLVLQEESWASVREWADHRSALDFRDWCGDDR